MHHVTRLSSMYGSARYMDVNILIRAILKIMSAIIEAINFRIGNVQRTSTLQTDLSRVIKFALAWKSLIIFPTGLLYSFVR